MSAPCVFCPTCARYVGAADNCMFCDWTRPAHARIPLGGATLWRVATSAAADGKPLRLGDDLCLPDRDGGITGVGWADGARRWRWPGEGVLLGGLAGAGGRVYAARREDDLLALTPHDQTLQVAWRLPLHAPGAPAAHDGRLYVGDGEGTVRALVDAGDRGEIIWQARAGGRVALAPLHWRRLVLVATSHSAGQLVALDAARGEPPVWTQPLGARAAAMALTRWGKKGEPAVVVMTDRGAARAYRLPEGEPLDWDYRVGAGSPLLAAGDDGSLAIGATGGEVAVLACAGAAPAWRMDLGEPLAGLALFERWLFVGGKGGRLHLLDCASGVRLAQWDAGEPMTAAPTIHNEMVVVGSGSGWAALPWHLGHWELAAARYTALGDGRSAAACLALAGQPDAAEQAWLAAQALDSPAWFWTGLGEDQRAAAAFRRAADAERTVRPALAAAYLNQAADRLEACEDAPAAEGCRKQAARMGKFPHLRLSAVNLPVGEAGLPMTAAIEVRNAGSGDAAAVRFRLGGRLAQTVSGQLTDTLRAGQCAVIEFAGLIPTASGRERLVVSAVCGACAAAEVRADASFDFDVAAPPPGLITVRDDAGNVRVRVPEGTPPPTVRIQGMAASVTYEVTPRAA